MGSDINVLSKITEQKILYLMLVAGLAANAALVTYFMLLGVDIHADVSFSLSPTFELDIGTKTLAAGSLEWS